MSTAQPQSFAWWDGLLATRPVAVSSDLADLDRGGFWAVVATFEGAPTLIRFADVRRAPRATALPAAQTWSPLTGTWRSSLSEDAYVKGVQRVRDLIEAGEVYQVNLCRVLDHEVAADATVAGLAPTLVAGNPAPYAGVVHVPEAGVEVVTASPELFLRRDGRTVWSGPIKGTAPRAELLLPKDSAENVMIVDLVRNDLARVSATGSVEVPDLLRLEHHPGLVHLVSTVRGTLAAGAGWPELFAATYPPGSVSGAPKSTALRAIRELEPADRGPYCGAVGWVDADAGTAELAVGIRTFWIEDGPPRRLRFGTGAGITWGSDPAHEWHETELKAARLVGLASGQVV